MDIWREKHGGVEYILGSMSLVKFVMPQQSTLREYIKEFISALVKQKIVSGGEIRGVPKIVSQTIRPGEYVEEWSALVKFFKNNRSKIVPIDIALVAREGYVQAFFRVRADEVNSI